MSHWYTLLKQIHIGSVAATFALFTLRGIWMWRDSPKLRSTWVRVLPHIVDTMLLASAVGLMLAIRQYPFVHAWLTAKVLALIAYIVLGTVALKRGRTKRQRIAALWAAWAVFAYIVTTAVTHDPWGVFHLAADGR